MGPGQFVLSLGDSKNIFFILHGVYVLHITYAIICCICYLRCTCIHHVHLNRVSRYINFF